MANTVAGALKIAAKKAGLAVDEYSQRVNSGMKRCTKCKSWKSQVDFGNDSTRSDGKDSSCFSCRRVKVRRTTKGQPSPHRGCHLSEETKRKISEAKRGMPGTATGKRTGQALINIRLGCRKNPPKGPRHPRWKGGITPLNKALRNTAEYFDWRDSVYKRDSYSCQLCGDNKGGNLNAHHIYSFADHPSLRMNLDNGVTLCESCHEEVHHQPLSTRNKRKKRGRIRKLKLLKRPAC